MVTSSVIVAQALGIEPVGDPAQKAGVCAFCGLPIQTGDPCAELKGNIQKTFVDDLYLAARGSQMLCGYCMQIKTNKGILATSHGVFSPAGVRPFHKWADIAASLVDPPEPPFVMTFSTANQQHMAWRAPVNYSRDLFYVRVGLKDLKIRRLVLLEAVEHCRVLGEALYPPQPEKPGKRKAAQAKKTLPNPFLDLSPDLKSAQHGALNPRIFNPEFSELRPHLQAVLSLTTGETWALRFVLTPNAGKP